MDKRFPSFIDEDFPTELSKAQCWGTTLGRQVFVAKEMSNEVLSGSESSYRLFRSKRNLGNEEDCSYISILFRGQPSRACITRETPVQVDGIILGGDISAIMEFRIYCKVQTSVAGGIPLLASVNTKELWFAV